MKKLYVFLILVSPLVLISLILVSPFFILYKIVDKNSYPIELR